MRPIAEAGNVNVDLIPCPVAPRPRPDTEVIVTHYDLRVGGAAGNSALARQATGAAFQCVANIGADPFGAWLATTFPDHSTNRPISSCRTTVSVGVTHPNGDRTFLATDGHLCEMTSSDVVGVLHGPTFRGGLLLLCGASVTEESARGYDAIFDWADRHGIAIALDTGWPQGWIDAIRGQATAWLVRSHIALFIEVEAMGLSDTDTVQATAKALTLIMPAMAIVVIKPGADGALAIDATGQIHHQPAEPVQVIDTIGAGDIFNAGFLAPLSRTLPLDRCQQRRGALGILCHLHTSTAICCLHQE